jgi:homoserine kinase type II
MSKDRNSGISSILCSYFAPDSWELVQSEGGVNNVTRQVKHQGSTYNLRLYENHQDSEKVEFEARVLTELQSHRLSFRVPRVVPAKDGTLYAQAEDGRLACLFEWIEGKRAAAGNLKQTESIGAALAELVTALAAVSIDATPAYEPYYDIYHIHPLVTREKLQEWLTMQADGPMADEAVALRAELAELEEELPMLKRLPTQLVHSDAVYGNLLVGEDDQVNGILDFEFVTMELRAMELAVYMGELVKPDQDEERLWQELQACLRGYGSRGRLTREELDALPRLIRLRRLVLVPHFLGRYWAGVDAEVPVRYVNGFASVRAWFIRNEKRFEDLCYQFITEEHS